MKTWGKTQYEREYERGLIFKNVRCPKCRNRIRFDVSMEMFVSGRRRQGAAPRRTA